MRFGCEAMQTLNLRQLEVFTAVVESGSFTAAAGRLYLAQSTVSGHIAALEKEIGLPLLIRTGRRKILLTEEGRKVYAHAKTILQSCGELSRALEEHSTRTLTLAASSVPLQYILPQRLAAFSGEQPDCRFTVLGGDSEDVHRLVREGEAQLGFAGAMLDVQSLHYELLAEDKLVLIAPDRGPYREMLAGGVKGNALLTQPLIFREDGSGTQQALGRLLWENGLGDKNVTVAARISSSEAILRAVACGLGCAVVSGLAAAAAPGVLTFPLEGKETGRRLYILRLRDRRLSPTARSFLEFLQKAKTNNT